MTPILITGGIDISVGSILGLCGVVLGLLLPGGLAAVGRAPGDCCSAIGLGAFNGVLIAYLRLPPFLVTLGMLSVARSPALIVSERPGRLFLRPGRSGDFRARRRQARSAFRTLSSPWWPARLSCTFC